MKLLRALARAAGLALVALTAPTPSALACGGTFCDNGPKSMPVDQTGENILFALDGTTVEAHIQIQYAGNAARFAWVLPVPALPEFSVGSEALFDNLLAGTVPRYGLSQQFDSCGDRANGAYASEGSTGSGGAGGASSGGGGPEVVYQASVGAYDVTVLKGGKVDEVVTWLDDNGYQQSPLAPPILEKYLEKKYLFVAVKLTNGAGVDQIHPLVVRYPGDKPCVPLELTAVAAKENMGVRAFFLGAGRVVPTGAYKHVEANPVRYFWQNLGSNYTDAVTHAVDSAVADGHAFVTEYAGPSNVVSPSGLYDIAWTSAPFPTLAAEGAITQLQKQGLLDCGIYGPQGNKTCSYHHPLVRPLLLEFVPPPLGLDEGEFYSCLSCYANLIDQKAWNGLLFAQAFEGRIVKPGKHAAELLRSFPYVSRLFTTISPAEMTADPEFQEHDELPPVTSALQATRRTLCSGRQIVILPDGRNVVLPPDNASWPPFSDVMPWAETIEEFPVGGARVVLANNTKVINEELAKWNASQGLASVGAGKGPGVPAGTDPLDPTVSGTSNPAANNASGNTRQTCSFGGTGGNAGSSFALLALAGALGMARKRRSQGTPRN